MNLVHTVKDLHQVLSNIQGEDCDKSIGFVPTMGALHAGHISLVEQCIADNDICVVSIFVNPTQFNNKEDLEKYPRSLAQDSKFLEEKGVDIIFAPTEEEIYPEPDTRQFDFGQIDKVMEGKYRPGHFNGVAQVVSRLFDLVKPARAYFGEKDFQQLAVIRAMVKQLDLAVEIVAMPIVRETSGLAMSSRNERLTGAQRATSVAISQVLFDSKKWMASNSLAEVSAKVKEILNSIEGLDVEYFEIVDGYSLQGVTGWGESTYVVGCIVVYCGDVRLLDNIVYKTNI